MNNFQKTYLHMIFFGLIIVSAFNNSLASFNIHLYISDSIIGKFFAGITLISIYFLVFNKYSWLPFLDETIIPSNLIPLKKNNGTQTITLKVKPNTKIAYWAATSSDSEDRFVRNAYGDYSNSGVVMSDTSGNAILNFDQPTGYKVPNDKYIKPHIHYRVLTDEDGMIGPVKTVHL